MKVVISLLLLLIALLSTPTLAQTAATTEDGLDVVLNHDGTWTQTLSGNNGDTLKNWLPNRGVSQTLPVRFKSALGRGPSPGPVTASS